MATWGCRIEDANRMAVDFDAVEAERLWQLTDGLDAATVSACPGCRSRILAVVAFEDLLDDAPVFARSGELRELTDGAPTLHLYVVDEAPCAHRAWRDPGFDEWAELEAERPRRV